MIVRLKETLLLVTAESEEERTQISDWAAKTHGHAFVVVQQDPRTVRLTDLGAEPVACRLPINITSQSKDPGIQLISNLAATPFELDGVEYASIEGYWQGLKFPDEARRRQIAQLSGQEARRAGFDAIETDSFRYGEQVVRTGTSDQWQLMKRACFAKFSQHMQAKTALLETGNRPLSHRTRRDSRTIPGVIMAEIWMKIRAKLNPRELVASQSHNRL